MRTNHKSEARVFCEAQSDHPLEINLPLRGWVYGCRYWPSVPSVWLVSVSGIRGVF